MEYIKPVLSTAETIYTLHNKVKANKKRCTRLVERVQILMECVKKLQENEIQGEDTSISLLLQGLKHTLDDAEHFVEKNTKENSFKKVVFVSKIEQTFSDINERLTSAFQGLCLLLQAEQLHSLQEAFSKCNIEDKEDAKQDIDHLAILQQQLTNDKNEIKDELRCVKETIEAGMIEMRDKIDAVTKVKESQPPCEAPALLEIQRYDIQIDEELVQETAASYKLYKGKYHKFPVAIKRFTNTGYTKRGIQEIFRKEVDTLKRFECPNILRMYGICIVEQEFRSPDFLIVMEYCELGTLRNVLDKSKLELSWQDKIHMSLGAARALYRLHLSEEKFKVHGCINSSRFLVAKGLQVKLSGFELAQTETSLKRNVKSGRQKSVRSIPYMSPEQLKNINHPFNKACEMYSFGIVLWEIATRAVPFKDRTNQEVIDVVVNKQYQEPLLPDCPQSFQEIIDSCRSHDSFLRPTSGVIVDHLERLESAVTT
ncbi:mixed lineage kinase domain-like protein [Protopterus annectens]|uniref:mixed lineage kinase domain-like protein n=1 Tax=Protopterus annectens TaxID=7888 RepID=UPI001CFB16DD|nr:mixed lineage kinase domain-like protein [Protopterus annectens]